ncbi:MAG: alpha-amylase, partial [Calditrichaeota bacterium]
MKKRYPQFYWLSFKYIPYTLSSPSIRRVEFHVSRQSRDKYQFEEFFFTSTGNVIFANFYAARLFAEKINAVRDVLHHPEEAASAAEINAMGLIDEIIHAILAYYRQEIAPTVFQEAHQFLQEQFPSQLRHTLLTFLEFFPPSDVYLGKRTPEEYLDEVSEGTPNEQIVLEELILLWLANQNPAFQKYEELFDDSVLQNTTPYPQIITELEEFFNQQPPVALISYMEPTPLFKFIRKPIDEAPDSIAEQLKYIQQEWGAYLSHLLTIDIERIKELERYGLPGLPSSTDTGTRLLRGLDYIIEEEKLRFHPGAGPAPTEVPDYLPLEEDIEQYSPDLDWMPNLVLIAKSTLVWLDQLSKKYQRSITRLDQIPDEELDLLKNWGFTGLWLIGIWERSKASKRIKQLCGNPEAESSAYSLFDYQIAEDLGGEPGYQNLKERCWKRGIRLACDMVPNHTGIDARWVMEHPEWYIQLPYSPFPSYTFNGPDLSWHPDIG